MVSGRTLHRLGARFRRLAKDYEWLPSSLAGLHWLACLANYH